jgi:hypothetical protein
VCTTTPQLSNCKLSLRMHFTIRMLVAAAKWHGEQADKASDSHFLHAHHDHNLVVGGALLRMFVHSDLSIYMCWSRRLAASALTLLESMLQAARRCLPRTC